MNFTHLYRYLFLCCLGCYPIVLLSQRDTLPKEEQLPENSDLIENFVQGAEEDGEFQFNAIFEDLEVYLRRPLNLNRATEEELQSLRLLSDLQIIALLRYRRELGDLIALEELQAVPYLDLPTINSLLPYITIGGKEGDYQLPLGQMITKGRNELYLAWDRELQKRRGYSNEVSSPFEGDPNRFFVRYRHYYENRLSFGVTMEKDPGEAFFKKSNKQGFDFYSAHFFLKEYRSWLKSFALGDYSVSLGQGLILHSGFGARKSNAVTTIKRGGQTIRPYKSVDENNFMRGAGLTLVPTEDLEISLFSSYNRRDANVIQEDTSLVDTPDPFFTSLQSSGFHRNANEIEDENAIQLFQTGARIQYKKPHWMVAANTLLSRFGDTFTPTLQPYNRFNFRGDQLLNLSLDYSYTYRNFHFFGETATSDNGKIATLNGALIGLDAKLNLAILHRYFDRAYQAINANPFAETSGARNEKGIYFGLEYFITQNWRLNGYFDLYEHPWLRFRAAAPSSGHDFRLRLTYYRKRKAEVYAEFRREIKEQNAAFSDNKLDVLTETDVFQGRLHVAYKVTKALELRTRMDAGFFRDNSETDRQTGFSIYQDIIYRPIGFPLSFSSRFALFDTDGYDVRYYNYENDLLRSFSVPAYYNRGTRFYINLRYRGIRNLTIEGRYAQTYWSNQIAFGSGNDETSGQIRSEISAQIKYIF